MDEMRRQLPDTPLVGYLLPHAIDRAFELGAQRHLIKPITRADLKEVIDGLDTPLSPGSTVGGCMIVNCVKAEVAQRLVQMGQPPKVLTAACIVGKQRATELFESAYDEHGRRAARLYASLGVPQQDAEQSV